MDVTLARDPKWSKIDHLFLLLTEGGKPPKGLDLPKEAARLVAGAGFTGRSEESITLLAGEPRKVTLLGLGKEEELTIRSLRAALYNVGKITKKQRDARIAVAVGCSIPKLSDDEATRTAADYLSQADYKYDAYITVKKDENPPAITATFVPFGDADPKRLDKEAKAIAAGVRTVRDLGNAPSNELTPARLAERAAEVAKAHGIKCTVYDKRAIEKMKMGGLLAVNKGSAEEPRFIVLEYAPRRAKTHVALVGKGITFDSGGISIKPAEKMEEMKFDMCGAAAVIGTMQAAALLALNVRITGVIASTENLPSGSAYKPGDIIRTMSGKTIEVVNTDAEGRVILADALHYASQQKPDHIIDYATLTGACVVALGSEAAGLFSNNDELARKLIESGERTGERLWRLPEWDEYKELIRSDWADMKNSGGRWGGAISAALFLKEYVDCASWAHLDIAGTAYAEHENAREARGATGAGVRVTVSFLESL
jgi:leucyl aminopeptidase